MTEAATEAFCERCGTRYTFEPPRAGGLARLRAASRGLADYVLTDHRSLGDAVSDAIGTADAAEGLHRADSFQRTFSFCLDCREYVCPSCWNAAAGRCVSCAASGAAAPAFVPAPVEPSPVDAPRATDPPPVENASHAPAAPSPAGGPDPGEDLEDDVIAAAIAAGIIHPPQAAAAALPTPGPEADAPGPEARVPGQTSEAPEPATEEPDGARDAVAEPDPGEMALRLATLPTIGSQGVDRPVGRPSFAVATDPVGDDAGAPVPPPWPAADDTGAVDAIPEASPASDPSRAAVEGTHAADPDPSAAAAAIPWPAVDETRGAVVAAGAGDPAGERTPEPWSAAEPVDRPWPPVEAEAGPPSDATIAEPLPAPSGGTRMIGRPSVPDQRLGAPKACVGCGLQLAAATRFCRRCGARQD